VRNEPQNPSQELDGQAIGWAFHAEFGIVDRHQLDTDGLCVFCTLLSVTVVRVAARDKLEKRTACHVLHF
jgi:hypothetical protein